MAETVTQDGRKQAANQPEAGRAYGKRATTIPDGDQARGSSMKCPNHLCQHVFEASPAACPKCGIPLPGAVLAGRFSLERIARVTPFLITLVAFDRERTAEAQIRLYVPRFGRRASSLKSEIKALKELQFEQLPRILYLDWDAEFPWVAEEKVQGGTLVGRLVGRDRPYSEPEAVHVLLEAARILEKLHTLHIYHRDIRPETLYNRDSDQRLVLGTPGWDREFQDKPGPRNRPVYLAPEAGGGRATPQADLFSLGVTAVHLLTGLNPEGLYNASSGTFQWRRAVKVSPRLAEIVDGLIAEAPGDRIQSAGRLAQLLSALDRDPPAPAAEAGPAPPQDPPGRQAAAAGAGALPGAEALSRAATAAASAETGTPDLDSVARPSRDARWTGLRAREAPGAKRERRLKALVGAMIAAVFALLGAVAALWRRLLETEAGKALAAHGLKVAVALGVATGAAAVVKSPGQGVPGSATPLASPAGLPSQAYTSPRHGLPDPIVGHDDRPVPVEPDVALVLAANPLPDPGWLSRWAARRGSAAEEQRRSTVGSAPPAARPDTALTGGRFAFSDGTRTEVSRILSLYSSIFPLAGGEFALGAVRPVPAQLTEISAAQLVAQTAGLPPSLLTLTPPAPPEVPAAAALLAGQVASASEAIADLVPARPADPRLEAGDARREVPAVDPDALGARSPYDRIAEPGTDPDDASGVAPPRSPYFIRINKTYRTLTLYRDGRYAAQFPIATGRDATTPDGRFTISSKIANPQYEGIPGGDARNPLGSRWLGLDVSYPEGRSIGLHGTNAPSSIGLADSGGCIRLSNEDVEKLYQLVPKGTPVEII